ncbi:neuraminidase-like domain-containing protein [Morganella morganii]|nr:neuraminidase-like domain-containing protein [Morganella morganii]MBT0400352.1 hypothetical protein [Morganella morganii subsp. morganii]
MDQITRILEKLNQQRSGKTVTLADFMPMSLAEVRSLTGSRLSREEAQLLHRAAIKEQQNNILYTARALTRANPLLKKEMGAARTYGATPYGYNDIIMPRADEFAAPGAVSSMFSPAGYLTELYREARGLHQKNSVNNLDKRRPDLAKLVLSQENLDKEISTLSLANEQLETALMAKAGQTDKNKYYETLATSRRSGVTPYNAPFEGIRNALAQQDFVLPDHVLSKGAESAAQMALYAGISPELYAILTEKTDGLSESATEALLKKNFPGVNTDSLMKPDALANYYELPRDEVQALPWISIPYGSSLKNTHNLYGQNKTQIIKAGDTDGDVFYTLTHTRLKNEYEHWLRFEYIDLIPLGNNQFCINFSISYLDRAPSGLHIGVVTPNSNYPTDIYSSFTATPEKGKHYSIQGTIPAAKVTPEITISVYTNIHNAWYGHSTFAVTKTTTVPLPLLLTLNKTLRLAKATGMTPLETQQALTRLKLKDTDSDATVLHRFCEFLLYRKRYNISSDDALILSGATISTVSYDGQLSQFDRMFNNPPLNGEVYSLGGKTVNTAENSEDKRLPYLLRALETDRNEINDIRWLVNAGNTEIENTLRRISEMYLVKLLADLCGITVSRLSFLHGMYDHKMLIKNLDDPERRGIINFLWQTTGWLSKQDISADTLSLLTYLSAPNQPTDEMNTLLDALRNAGIDNKNTDTLRATMAPVIAGTMQLENPEQGEAVLRWLDNNHPDKVPLTSDFWVMLINNKTPDLQAKWCQALAQRVLVIRTLSLSGTELRILSTGAPVSTVKELREISEFHRLVNRCGNNAGNVLEKLNKRALSVSDLESCANIPYTIILGALGIDLNTYITTWKQLAKLPACIDMADTLHILPKEFTSLFTITEKTTPTYSELTTVAGKLQAGLNEQQTKQLQNQSEQCRSEALSGEYRALVMGKPLANRDDIWRTLLIDGKVSAEITTTPLADAIAGIQLYINRTVAGDEPGADSAVLGRQFFKDWDTYNKRYSTWAGVSQLVYYPENYIDPTIRIGQTGMMNTMLEQLSQSELNNDTLEDGFRQYLTAFEQVANLKVISGYHDAVEIDEGNTWFIGTSQTEPKKYYWRKADHSKCQNGHFAANAWSDWKEITCAINPYQDMVRPVIFRSRLYLLWVEKQVRKDDDGKKEISSFTLKLTHIKYDGSWASPFSYDVTNEFVKMKEGRKGLYCTENPGKNALTVACYLVKDSYNFSQKKTTPRDNNKAQEKTEYFGCYIFSDMSSENIPDIRSVLEYTAPQLDTTTITRVNSLLLHSYSSTLTPENETGTSNANISLDTKYYYLSTSGNKTHLVVNSEACVAIHVDFIPPLLRPEFITRLKQGADSYRTEGTVYSPVGDFPGGECTVSLTEYMTRGINIIYLSIPGNDKTLPFVNSAELALATPEGGAQYECIHYGSDKNRHYFTCKIDELISGYPADKISITFFIRNKNSKREKTGVIKYSGINKNLHQANLRDCSLEYIDNGNTIGTFQTINHGFGYKNDVFETDCNFDEHKLDITDFIRNEELNLTLQAKF